MFHPWHDVSPSVPGRDLPGSVRAVVEIPRGSSVKYELDKPSGRLRLDRVLRSAVYYPANYGFIPQTYAEDDDPLDILVLSSESVVPLCLVDAEVIGVMTMIDEGKADHKIIATLAGDPEYENLRAPTDLPPHIFRVVRRFFEDYKMLENKAVEVDEAQPAEAALPVIEDALERYDRLRRSGSLKGLPS
jgi:inorganic pyrophosphatase